MKQTEAHSGVYLRNTQMFCAVRDVTAVCNVILVRRAP